MAGKRPIRVNPCNLSVFIRSFSFRSGFTLIEIIMAMAIMAVGIIGVVRLYAGETALLRLHPTNSVYAIANGGTVSLEWTVIEK